MSSWVDNIVAITLFQEDLEAAKAFYQHVFELPVRYEDTDSAMFMFGTTMINLLRATAADELIAPAPVGDGASRHRMQLTLEVENVDEMCQQLAEIGVRLLNGPMDRPWGLRSASFEDPGGHIWEIIHPTPVGDA